jgi:hypothetical protein
VKLDDFIKEFRATTTEPLWKIVLNWGTVVMFLLLPLMIMMIQLYLLSHPEVIKNPETYRDHFKYLLEFQRNLAILVFGLAGLRTYEQIKANGKPPNPAAPQHYKD